MNRPLVSILINNYNYGHFLQDAIQSVLNQTYKNIEIIIVDDGSTDNSRDIIKKYDENVISILKDNAGQASAFNIGFSKSKGEIILFLDSDDIFLPGKVEKIIQIFEDNHNIGWCFHALEFTDKDLVVLKDKKTYALFNENNKSGVYDLRNHINRGKVGCKIPLNGTATSGLCFKRSLLTNILPMPEEIRITSDDYIKCAAFVSTPGYFLLEKIALQRIHGNNLYTLREDEQKQFTKNKIEILTAYWLRKNFPLTRKYANKIFGISINKHKYLGERDSSLRERIGDYRSTLNILENLDLCVRSFYYHLKR
ncbi:glycosyltransferase family 2 protein [Adonisia turfae]|uniref:Glycosyltransferase n=1 Tax=Adonisia turfae CCMR0081 TaxID=2292702 RepID=A0A6M0RDQ3_9CYAN|nr:glycosyltransferase [Adonisia turfae]NEZ54409.1 glycosyltransferase [Adonisia turfae CCMR0081]